MRRDRSLLESLKEDAIAAAYRERVRGRLATRRGEAGLGNLQRELLGEMASALGRAEAHVLEALSELHVIDAKVAELELSIRAGTREQSELDACMVTYRARYAVAEQRLWELMVHREALGLGRHETLARHYPLPPKKRGVSRVD